MRAVGALQLFTILYCISGIFVVDRFIRETGRTAGRAHSYLYYNMDYNIIIYLDITIIRPTLGIECTLCFSRVYIIERVRHNGMNCYGYVWYALNNNFWVHYVLATPSVRDMVLQEDTYNKLDRTLTTFIEGPEKHKALWRHQKQEVNRTHAAS